MSSMFPDQWKLAGFDIGAFDTMPLWEAFSPTKSMYKKNKMAKLSVFALLYDFFFWQIFTFMRFTNAVYSLNIFLNLFYINSSTSFFVVDGENINSSHNYGFFFFIIIFVKRFIRWRRWQWWQTRHTFNHSHFIGFKSLFNILKVFGWHQRELCFFPVHNKIKCVRRIVLNYICSRVYVCARATNEGSQLKNEKN